MKRKIKPRSFSAKALSDRRYRAKVVRNRKAYRRKGRVQK
jgi:hypothetical protein